MRDLRRCPACDAIVYKRAPICPGCGRVNYEPKSRGCLWALLLVLGGVVAFVWWLGTS